MSVTEVLDTLEDLVDKAWSIPLSGGKAVVNAEQVKELISQIRLNIPTEVKQAKMIVADRSQIIVDAKKEADSIVQIAQAKAEKLLTQDEVYKAAQQKANEMLAAAQQQSREIKKATNEFVDNTLGNIEENIAKNLSAVKEMRHAIARPQQK